MNTIPTQTAKPLGQLLSSKRQQGSILIVSLVILTSITVIGVAGIRSTIVEEKMASNTRDRAMAFQAAEAALQRGIQFFVPLVGTGKFSGGSTGGQYSVSETQPDYWDNATWTADNSFGYIDAINSVANVEPIPLVATQPRYIMRYVGDIKMNNNSLSIGNYGSQTIGDVSDFRITARGTGVSDYTMVVLQAHYGKRL